ncbi:hypothetical protein CEXT_754181 [Caerostris extrusa]|uniref:Uncharacterized protein n=1 Tax=Caerostris extrusa TaxID=172846 RepID=A0AAV4MTZ1_CAEEX|nr:hypothetical protein CEXT_754181 [Caerostris extrusa]
MINYCPHLNRYQHFIVSRWFGSELEIRVFKHRSPSLPTGIILFPINERIGIWDNKNLIKLKQNKMEGPLDANCFITSDEWRLSGVLGHRHPSKPAGTPQDRGQLHDTNPVEAFYLPLL